MLAQTFLSALALSAVSVSAIKVTYPSDRDNWSTSGAQMVKWDSVNTDPTSFAMVLVNQDSSFLASPATLNENVTTSSNSASVTFPSGNFPAGTRFQVNFIKTISQDTSILAQSGYFNITQSAAAASSSSSSSSAAASTASMSSVVKTSTAAGGAGATASGTGAAATAMATATSSADSGGVVNIPNSASTSATPSNSGALSSLSSPATLLAALGFVGLAALF